MKKKQHQKHTVLVKTSAKKQKFTTQRRHHRTRPPQLFAFPQIKLFSSGRDLITSSHRSPPPAPSPALPAAGPSLLLLVGLRCCSNLLLYDLLPRASGTLNSQDGKWYLCMNISASKICYFFFFDTANVVCISRCLWTCVFSRNTVSYLCLSSTFFHK